MSEQEKLLLLQLILEDIRGNWAFDVKERVESALELAEQLKHVEDMLILINTINDFDYSDGRYFRYSYPEGYEDMDVLHGLSRTFKDKSKKFKRIAKESLTHPDQRFDDWD